MEDIDWSRYEKLSQLHPGVLPLQHRADDLVSKRDITFRSSWVQLNKFYKIVTTNNPRASIILHCCGFESIFQFNFKYGDKGLTEAICERWWRKTKTFHFKEFEIGLTPLDFYRLTGIPIGGGRRIAELPKEAITKQQLESMDDIYFRGVLNVRGQRINVKEKSGSYDSKSTTIRVSHLTNYILSRDGLDNTDIAEELSRMFLLWCIGSFLLADRSVKVDKRWCLVLDNLDVVGSYDWGTPALGVIYTHLDDWSSCKIKDIGGMTMILEYWYYFYFRNCQPVLVETLRQSDLDVHPAIALFNVTNLKNKGQRDLHKHSVSDARCQIDMRMGDAVIWDPWFKHSQWQASEAFQDAWEMSKRRCVFRDKDGARASCYLVERCMRQVFGSIVIPCNPPRLEDVLDSTELVLCDHYTPVPEEVYAKFWKDHSVGALLTETTHIDTHDALGVGHPSIPRSLMPQRAPGSMSSQTYRYNQFTQPMTQLPNLELDVPFYKDSYEERVDVPLEGQNPYDFSDINVPQEELRNFAGRAFWLIQKTRQVVFDESRRRAMVSTPPTRRSTGSSDGLFNSSQDEHTFPSTYEDGLSMPESQLRRKRTAAGPSTSNACYVPHPVEPVVEPNQFRLHSSPGISDRPTSGDFLQLSVGGGSWQGNVHGSGERGDGMDDVDFVQDSQYFGP